MFLWAGCALVIDLGDDVSLRTPDTSAIDSASDAPSDAGSEAATIGDGAPKCGLRQTQNEECGDCFDKACCDKGVACADDPACVRGLSCLQYCMGQFECIVDCMAEARGDAAEGPLDRLATCSQDNCKICKPSADCIKYGTCAYQVTLDASDILRNNSRDIVLQNDDVECIKQLDVLASQYDASACHPQ